METKAPPQNRANKLLWMNPDFQRPDTIYFQAAEGWLALGNHVEATAELDRIKPELQAHPAVLKLRWDIAAAARKWEDALSLAETIVSQDPEDSIGWINRSYALHELGRTEEARNHLLTVVDMFPQWSTFAYNLACYECRLGRLNEALCWLKKAFEIQGEDSLRQQALQDPDLEALRKEIENLG